MGNERPFRARLTPSIADIFFISITFFLFFQSKAKLLGDGDTGYHIRAGEYIIRTHSVPKYDLFSYHTPSLPWTAHEWLSEVIMALIHSWFGLSGIVAFFAFLLALTIYLIFKILRRYHIDLFLSIVITGMVLITSQLHWLARPHLFSFLLMVITHYLLECWYRDRMNRLYLLPAIMLLWVNLHGGFAGGFILMGAYLIGTLTKVLPWSSTPPAMRRKLGQLGLAIAASLIVCLVNPQGYRILMFPFKLVTDTFIMDHVAEFLSPDFHEWMPFKHFLLLLMATCALSRRTLDATELVLILIFTDMSLYSARYIPLFAFVAAPILARSANESLEALRGGWAERFRQHSKKIAQIDSRTSGYLWPAVTVLIVAAATFSGKFPHSFDEEIKAVAACEFLMKERISGNMFNNDEFGDYLIYRSHPRYKVFLDGRSDMYGTPVLKEYYEVINFRKGWHDILDKYKVTLIFYDSNSGLSRFLLRDPEWVLIYSDKVANIFVQKLPQYKSIIEKYGSVKAVVF
jgi:hypothetical protein